MPLSPCFSYKTNEGRFMLKPWRRRWRWAAWLAALAMTGCSTTRVESNHHLVSAASEALFATVYFLRPGTERAAGISDNTLTVEVDGSKLLTIAKGEYTLVNMRPRVHTTVTLENLTEVGPTISAATMSDYDVHNWIQRGTWPVKTLSKKYDFEFDAGKTYFLLLEPVDGEFRGVFFTLRSVDAFTAKQVAQDMRALGGAPRAPLSTSGRRGCLRRRRWRACRVRSRCWDRTDRAICCKAHRSGGYTPRRRHCSTR